MVIVGAGIAGLATAVALKRVGVRALVLEKSEGLRATGAAISLQQNAWLALDALGVAHKLTTIYEPFTRYLNFQTTFMIFHFSFQTIIISVFLFFSHLKFFVKLLDFVLKTFLLTLYTYSCNQFKYFISILF